jgi:putative flippase GtrA
LFIRIRRKYPFLQEIFFYGLIGLFSAGLDSIVFLFMRKLHCNLYLSNFIGINVGICCSFLLNTFLNFRMPNKLFLRGIKFFAVGYSGLLLSMFIMHIGVHTLRLKDIVIKIVSVFLVAVFQFTLNRLIIFRKTLK